jgi:hypothetical protein
LPGERLFNNAEKILAPPAAIAVDEQSIVAMVRLGTERTTAQHTKKTQGNVAKQEN